MGATGRLVAGKSQAANLRFALEACQVLVHTVGAGECSLRFARGPWCERQFCGWFVQPGPKRVPQLFFEPERVRSE
jgi:hypothetical protein